MKLRFTIRDLLWLTVVVALAAGWWISYRQMQSKINRLQSAPPMISFGDERVERAMQMDSADLQ
jgi:hypothetical protein